MKWFGESWGAPVCYAAEHAPTPIGKLCGYCPHSIRPGDQGLLLPYLDPAESTVWRDLPFHLVCFLRSVGAEPR